MSSSRHERIKLDTGATTILRAPIPRAKSSASIALGLVVAEPSGHWDRPNLDAGPESPLPIGPAGPSFPYVPVSLPSTGNALHPTGLGGVSHRNGGSGWGLSATHPATGSSSRFLAHSVTGKTAPGGGASSFVGAAAASGSGGGGGGLHAMQNRSGGSAHAAASAAEASSYGAHLGPMMGHTGMGMAEQHGGRLPAIAHGNSRGALHISTFPAPASSAGTNGFGGGGGGGTVPLPSIGSSGAGAGGGGASAASTAAASSDAPVVVSYAPSRIVPNKSVARAANRYRRGGGGGDGLSQEPSGASVATEGSGFLRGIRRFFGLDSTAAAAAAAAARAAAAAAASEAAAAEAEEPLVPPSPSSVALLTSKHMHELERVNRVRSSLLADATMRAAAASAANSVFVLGAGNNPAGSGSETVADGSAAVRVGTSGGTRVGTSHGTAGRTGTATGGNRVKTNNGAKSRTSASTLPDVNASANADEGLLAAASTDPVAGGDAAETEDAEGVDGGGGRRSPGPGGGGEAAGGPAAQAVSPAPGKSPSPVTAPGSPGVLEHVERNLRNGRSFTQMALRDPANPMFRTAKKLVQVQEQLSYLEDKHWREKMIENVPMERPILMAEGWKL